LLAQVRPETRQPWQQVLKLSQIDLSLRLGRPCAFREDVQDDRTPVEHLHSQYAVDVAHLRRREIIVKHHQIHLVFVDISLDFLQFALAHIGARMHLVHLLQENLERDSARSLREQLHLVEVFLCFFFRNRAVVDPYQDRFFRAAIFFIFFQLRKC
jgi:hypothetical protein